MARFISLPVGQGDAFYLERNELSVLIDGGRSRKGFPSMFQSVTERDGVDVVVCTHNDADHANGIHGFLEAGLRCDEVWLPGRWLSVLPDVLRPFVEVFEHIANDIMGKDVLADLQELQSGTPPIETLAAHADHDFSDDTPAEEDSQLAEDGWPEACVQMLEQAEPWEASSYWPWQWHPGDWLFSSYWNYRQLGPTGVRLLWSAIDAACRIRAIATEAFHRGIPVRWFEFKPAAPSGGISALQPINAREVASIRPSVSPLLARLALTTSNKESLVFWSPPNEHHPGVLFTADSDLADIRLPTGLYRAIVTSPHHGSEANANAYSVVAATDGASSITWVRSDGRYRSRPGNSYLSVSSRRLCTLCRRPNGGMTTKQTVHLYASRGVWTRHQSNRVCSCQ